MGNTCLHHHLHATMNCCLNINWPIIVSPPSKSRYSSRSSMSGSAGCMKLKLISQPPHMRTGQGYSPLREMWVLYINSRRLSHHNSNSKFIMLPRSNHAIWSSSVHWKIKQNYLTYQSFQKIRYHYEYFQFFQKNR